MSEKSSNPEQPSQAGNEASRASAASVAAEAPRSGSNSVGAKRRYEAKQRSTPLAARGEPMVWLTGGALAVCVLMVIGLITVVIVGGVRTFWPKPIELVQLRGDAGDAATKFLGVMTREEGYIPSAEEQAKIDAMQAAGTLPAAAINARGEALRRLYRQGNREITNATFRWVPVWMIEETSQPRGVVFLERSEWGVWLGEPRGIVQERVVMLPGPAERIELKLPADPEGWRTERTIKGTRADGTIEVLERRIFDASHEQVIAKFDALHDESLDRRAQIASLKQTEIGRINAKIERQRLNVRAAEIELDRARRGAAGLSSGMSVSTRNLLAAGALVGCVVLLVLGVNKLRRKAAVEVGFLPPPEPRRTLAGVSMLAIGCMLGLYGWTEHAFGQAVMTAERLETIRAEAAAETARLNEQYAVVQKRLDEIDQADAQWRLLCVELTSGREAPEKATDLETLMRMSQVVRMVAPNDISWLSKAGVYLDRWREFLTTTPREANTEGGIFPVIFGTVSLTILLSIVVVPLGVIAALYLREYAKQGPVTSAVRIAINNLAGVPSIVYGVFGLGFFVTTMGQYVDTGSGVRYNDVGAFGLRAGHGWWLGVLGLGSVVVGAVIMGMLATPTPGKRASDRQMWMARVAAAMWVIAAIGALAVIAFTPYFTGLFEERAPSPTFGSKGLLWSAVTLALLTLPVVIVATEEAVAAVPRTMREGSYGCGASKWQTIQRVVLPRAMPGIMTGMILAMARGAGEVAPLMLVGAVKLTPQLTVDGTFPFLHLDRQFMHLGFHIYDVGFQSPDSEAARPIVWCTTFLLIVVVVLLNLTAIRIRSRLRRKYMGDAF